MDNTKIQKSVSLEKDVAEQIEKLAAESQRSFSMYVNLVLRRYLQSGESIEGMDQEENKFYIYTIEEQRKSGSYTSVTLRITKNVKAEYDSLSKRSGHSRSKLMEKALEYALENLEFIQKENP